MTITTAIIGLGIMGRRMLEHMDRHEGFAPATVWDPDAAACALARDMVPGVTVTDSAEAAIAGADLVYLACPPAPRKTYALAAAEQGKAVFLEKPLGVDIEQSRDLVALLEQSGVPAAVNFVQAAGLAMAGVVEARDSGAMGDLAGADIVVTYAHWPRGWQAAADWLRFRDEGGPTREVVSHFVFFAERILGPLRLAWSHPTYPADPALCETHVAARLETASGQPVTLMVSVGGAQPDRQELTIKGSATSHRISEFFREAVSDGGPWEPVRADPADPRADSLRAQLDQVARMMAGHDHLLATPQEALRVQILIEGILAGQG
ncbi:Gfo/Idh/MocA family protein [Sulfitobacter sabulilitoris]|uniref:Gfo/Idh/MocA family oxidoreductase n=1 Tax=Sulfitobacter sabulilitoris TaxID=2562655 RepID=A0A5S3P896_9RHOB|nr:Gfo/Idh/MocA family oxidoreductase [Sulfitobacter sabulilitoris]TMM49592.1 Gfo/Idh/MocA family oxidoreductase [Sulfitobacter sabulilitoris]